MSYILAFMTWEDYQSILETLEILSDDEAVEQLRCSIKEVKEGASCKKRRGSRFLNRGLRSIVFSE